MINFYHSFILAAAKIMSPLYSPLAGKPKTPKTLEWIKPMIATFQYTKAALARAVMLVHPCSNTPTSLIVNASKQAVGAVLLWLLNGIWQPLAFFSKTTASGRGSTLLLTRSCSSLYWCEAFQIFTSGPGVCHIYSPHSSHSLHGQNIRSMV